MTDYKTFSHEQLLQRYDEIFGEMFRISGHSYRELSAELNAIRIELLRRLNKGPQNEGSDNQTTG